MTGQAERVLELGRLKSKQGVKSPPKIFAFTSGKGGTGKTFLSLNLAYSLSRHNKKVLFVDLDPNLSNANIMLNIIATKTIFNFFTGRNLLHELITEVEPNFHFIFGDSGKLNYPKAKNDIISQLFNQLRNLRENYDFIFLDTGAGASEEVISIISKTDGAIIVASPEPTAVMDAYVMIKLLSSGGYTGKKFVIINKCGENEDGRATFNNLTMAADRFLKEKLHLLGTVSFDQSVNKAIITQQLFLSRYPKSTAGAQIVKISKALTEFIQLANIHHQQVELIP